MITPSGQVQFNDCSFCVAQSKLEARKEKLAKVGGLRAALKGTSKKKNKIERDIKRLEHKVCRLHCSLDVERLNPLCS